MLNKIRSFTLVETVASIIIIGIAVVGVFAAITHAMRGLTSPIILQQASTIASSYLEEVMAKEFPSSMPCSPSGGARSSYTNICDYHNLSDNGTKDQFGNSISGLNDFNITVNIAAEALPDLTAGTDIVKINISVQHNNVERLTLSA